MDGLRHLGLGGHRYVVHDHDNWGQVREYIEEGRIGVRGGFKSFFYVSSKWHGRTAVVTIRDNLNYYDVQE